MNTRTLLVTSTMLLSGFYAAKAIATDAATRPSAQPPQTQPAASPAGRPDGNAKLRATIFALDLSDEQKSKIQSLFTLAQERTAAQRDSNDSDIHAADFGQP
jgi:Spy/CpxP family protein refolding chaperone